MWEKINTIKRLRCSILYFPKPAPSSILVVELQLNLQHTPYSQLVNILLLSSALGKGKQPGHTAEEKNPVGLKRDKRTSLLFINFTVVSLKFPEKSEQSPTCGSCHCLNCQGFTLLPPQCFQMEVDVLGRERINRKKRPEPCRKEQKTLLG